MYAECGEYKKSLAYYLPAYKIFKSRLGFNHERTQTTYYDMKLAYVKLHRRLKFDLWLKGMMAKSKIHIT